MAARPPVGSPADFLFVKGQNLMTNPADEYLKTVNRLEPEISPIDYAGALTSIAISLKRLADTLDFIVETAKKQGAFDQ